MKREMSHADALANLLIASTPGGIERQEADEQRRAVASQQLPKDGTATSGSRLGVDGKTDRQVWESMGFTFGEDADDIFINVTFPAGWKLVPSDHSMWSKLVDGKGNERASMFYKGAFYDRSAHIGLSRRFTCGSDYEAKEPYPVVVKDRGKVIQTIGVQSNYNPRTATREESQRAWQDRERLDKLAESWLDEKYPDWRNPLAYWDEKLLT